MPRGPTTCSELPCALGRKESAATRRRFRSRERSRSDGPLARAGCSLPGETGARRRRGLPVLRCLCARRRRSAVGDCTEWHCDHAGSAGRVSARDRPRSRRPSEVAARDWATGKREPAAPHGPPVAQRGGGGVGRPIGRAVVRRPMAEHASRQKRGSRISCRIADMHRLYGLLVRPA